MKTALKINDTYSVISVAKNGCSTVAAQTLIYHEPETYDFNYFKDAHYKHLNCINKGENGLIFPLTYKYLTNVCDLKKNKNEKIIFIFRDPIQRFLSSFKTDFIGKNMVFKNFLFMVIHNFFIHKNQLKNIDIHYRPQYTFVDFNDIDIFIELNDYENFCKENNIPFIKLNQNPDKNYKQKIILTEKQKSLIKKIYEKDYEMIDKIKKSGKLYGTL